MCRPRHSSSIYSCFSRRDAVAFWVSHRRLVGEVGETDACPGSTQAQHDVTRMLYV